MPRTCSPFALTAALVLLALAPVACGGSPSLPADTIVIGSARDMETVNELISAGSRFNADIVDQLFLSLLEEQPDFVDHPPSFKPRLAQRYEFSSDRRTLTFHLRRDVVWSDGTPITAEDVRFTWEAQIDPDLAWDWSFAKGAIREVEVVDPHTVRYHFDRVYAAQLLDANEGVILPRHVWSQLPFADWRSHPTWFLDHLVTSGPFTLERWDPQQRIVLRRNPRYYETGLPLAERVVFQVIPDEAKLLAQFLAGELDMIRNLEATDAERIIASDRARLIHFPANQYTFVNWNTERPFFAEPEVRRALALASDRQTIVDVIWQGYARVGAQPITAEVWARHPEIEPWPYDPQAAEEIFERHGWIDSDGDLVRERDGVRFSFVLATNPGNRSRADASLMLQDQLRRVGIEVEPRRVEMDTLSRQAMEHDFDAVMSSLSMDTSLDLTWPFHSDSIDNGANWGSYRNAEVDRLIEASRQETDDEPRRQMLHRIQEILHQEQPLLFLWEPHRLVAASRRVEGLEPTPLSDFANLTEWRVVP